MSAGAYLTCVVTFGGDKKAEAHFNPGITSGTVDLHHLMVMDEVTREFKHLVGADELEDDVLDNLKRQIHLKTGGA